MTDINAKMADIRKEADDKYGVSKDIAKEAAILYSRIEKIHAAKAILDRVKDNLQKYAAIPKDVEETIISESLDEFLETL